MKYLFAAVLIALATTAAAHTALVSSVPAWKSTVAGPVKELKLEFGGDVRLTAVVLTDAQGVTKKVASLPAEVGKKFAIAVEEDLAPGAYVVTWRAVGADTHVVTGEFRFKVAGARRCSAARAAGVLRRGSHRHRPARADIRRAVLRRRHLDLHRALGARAHARLSRAHVARWPAPQPSSALIVTVFHYVMAPARMAGHLRLSLRSFARGLAAAVELRPGEHRARSSGSRCWR